MSIRALLCQPRTPRTYWGFHYSLPLAKKRAILPPLGLITVAALLPADWGCRLVDLNVAELQERDLEWADVVLVGGMLLESDSMREILRRASAAGCRTVVGGPAATACPERFPEADHVFRGEAEGRLAPLLEAIAAPRGHSPRVLAAPPDRPDLSGSPVPRFDLLAVDSYLSLSLQYSRGCPFNCEFCNIVSLFGRRPRVKTEAQIVAELDAIHAVGFQGTIFVVDDNFIGNRKEVARLLPRVAAWQDRNGRPFALYTEASVDLAAREDLMRSMVDAGFTAVFVGLETPSPEALREAGKTQNLKRDLAESVLAITRAGMEVHAGFIVGFDSDDPSIFQKQFDFIQSLPIPMAMIGMLNAFPGTALWARVEREGRLRGEASGSNFTRPNFEPVMDERDLLRGFRWLLSSLYTPKNYFARCRRLLDELGPGFGRTALRDRALRLLARATWYSGVKSPRFRRHYWSLVLRTLLHRPRALATAVAHSLAAQHFVHYTERDVIPALDRTLAELAAVERKVDTGRAQADLGNLLHEIPCAGQV